MIKCCGKTMTDKPPAGVKKLAQGVKACQECGSTYLILQTRKGNDKKTIEG